MVCPDHSGDIVFHFPCDFQELGPLVLLRPGVPAEKKRSE